jgi:hypothetical protein
MRVILLFLVISLCVACNPKSDGGMINKHNRDADLVEGVWELTDQFWVKDDDTLLLGPDEIPVRHKIYLDGYVIWTGEPSSDSLEWHGYGTYILTHDTLTEKLVSMSLPMKAELGSEDEIIYKIEVNKDFCKQETDCILRGTIYLSVEEWKRLNP